MTISEIRLAMNTTVMDDIIMIVKKRIKGPTIVKDLFKNGFCTTIKSNEIEKVV